jgi:predicted amidohydrolase YtcJ
VEPTKEALDAVTGDRPAALMAKDGHSLWLNTAALAHANGNLAVPGGVVETDAQGEPTGVLREESAWEFRRRYVFELIGEDASFFLIRTPDGVEGWVPRFVILGI